MKPASSPIPLASNLLMHPRSFGHVRSKLPLLAKAQKFVLSADAQSLLLQLNEKFSGSPWDEILQFTRLPYALCWFEAQMPGVEREDKDCLRSGYLFESKNAEHTRWALTAFAQRASDCHVFMISPEVEVDLSQHKFRYKALSNASPVLTEKAGKSLLQSGCLILCALNCKNLLAAIPAEPPPPKLEKARIKRGKQPFISYRVLDLKLTTAQRNAGRAAGLSETEIRAHLVRGHFKHRKSGIYWWSPFVRGNRKNGIIFKDYLISA